MWAIGLSIIILSLSGIPPILGFYSKILILSEMLFIKYTTECILLMIISCFSSFYYIKIIKIIFFEKIKNLSHFLNFKKSNIEINIISSLSICLILIFSIFPAPLWLFCHYIILHSNIF